MSWTSVQVVTLQATVKRMLEIFISIYCVDIFISISGLTSAT